MSHREAVAAEFHRLGGNVSALARELGLARSTVHYHINRLGLVKSSPTGSVGGRATIDMPLPPEGEVRRYILTSAQDGTPVHRPVLCSLQTLAAALQATIMVSRFTYSHGVLSSTPEKPGARGTGRSLWYDPLIEPYVCDDRRRLAPGLVWCGEMNILPTATRPLSGFETYTGQESGIFPHVKFALQSIASSRHARAKMNYTTGTITQRNYLQKKAGLRAEHHHCYGGLLVEVDSAGRWWVRQLNSTESGEIWDLDRRVMGDTITSSNRVEAITWGDVHVARLEDEMRATLWGSDGMLEELRPRHQFLHDLFDMRARNHHDRSNPHKMYENFIHGVDSVAGELAEAAEFLRQADRRWCRTVVVNSNHDNALERWLREADYRDDPVNAEFFLEAQLEKYRSIKRGDDGLVLRWALQRFSCPDGVVFLGTDESYLICTGDGNGIECGMHGHLGINGSRASPLSLSKMGMKANTAHTHSAEIVDGMYVAGGSCSMDLGYNQGPSSWSQSHIVTYPSGKRAIITMNETLWKAVEGRDG